MKIVLDIPEKDVPSGQEIKAIDLHFIAGEVCECSYPYKVLPKGHGRLIDEKDLSLMTVHLIDGMFVCDAPTIIEADGGNIK